MYEILLGFCDIAYSMIHIFKDGDTLGGGRLLKIVPGVFVQKSIVEERGSHGCLEVKVGLFTRICKMINVNRNFSNLHL